MNKNNSFGDRIAQLRKERGYTQKELAAKMNINWSLISDYERGKLRLHDTILIKFCHALEVSCDDILGIADNTKPNKKIDLKIIRRLKRIEKFSQPMQKKILQNLDLLLDGAETHGY